MSNYKEYEPILPQNRDIIRSNAGGVTDWDYIVEQIQKENPVPQISEEDKKRYEEIDAKDGENITFWNLLDFDNWGKRLSVSNEYAGKQIELSHLNTLWFQNKISSEQMAKRQNLQKELEAYQRVVDKYGTVESMFTRGALNLGHQVWDYTAGGAEKGAKYATAGLALASAGAITGVGAPASLGVAGAAIGYGFAAGSAEYAWEQGAGDIFSALMEQKDVNGNVIDEETARALAAMGGVGSAALEMAGTILGVKTVAPGISKAMTEKIARALQSKGVQKILGNETTQKITKNLGLQTFAQTAKNYALGTGGEIATELGQEVLTFGVEELGRAIQGGVYSDAHGYDELMERLKDTAYETFITVGGVYGVGAGRSGISHYVKSRKERQELDTLVQASQSPEVKKYPYLAKSMMQKAFDNGFNKDKRYTYFPAEDFTNALFQTDEGIRLARELGVTEESLQEAINLDMPVCVETEKAAAFLYANDKYKHLADNATFNPALMSAAEMAEYERQGQDFIQQAEQAEQLADEAVNLATEDMDKSDLDILADSKVEELMQAGYSEREATNYAKVFAAHAQRFAPLWGESPQDFMNRVKITEEQSYDGSISKKFILDKRQIYGQPINDDVDVDAPVEVVTIEPRFAGREVWEFTKNKEVSKLKKELSGGYKNKNTGWDIKLTGYGIEHAVSSVGRRGIGGIEHIEAVANLPMLIENAVLIESHTDRKEQGLSAVHRMYAPMQINNDIFTVKLTVKESKEGMEVEIEDIRKLYDVALEKKMSDGATVPPHTPSETAGSGHSTPDISEITIRELLRDVKDSEGNRFFQNEVILTEEKLQADLHAWQKTVDKFEKGELNPRKPVIMLRNTPLVLSLLGADKDLTVSTNYRTLNKVLREKHKLPVDVMKQVPEAMTDPIMIFKSATVANDYVMMLDLKDDKGATVVVPVSLNYDGIASYTVNYVPSVYGRQNPVGTPNNNWFINQIEQGNLVYQNNKKSREWRTSSGKYYPRVGSDLITHGRNKNILTDKDLSRAKNTNPTYYQNSSPRGLIRFNPKTQEAMITVFKDKKDFSTVLHETSHYFLQTLANAYQMENAPAWVKENFETLAREMGFDPSQPLSTETHERFARLGEAYFREGKAPREELAGAFNMFKGWLTSLYRYVSKLLGRDSLNDEIRSVFDNMLATEEQIELAKRNREKESSIQILAKKFNLNSEQTDLLQKEKDRADKKASAIILLNKIQGLKNAEENARKEVSEIVRTSDYYNSLDTIRKNGRISFESLLGFLDEDTANSIKTKWKDYFSDGENAMSLDEAAIYFNTSAEQFINLLFNELPAKDYIDRYVQNARNKFEASFNADVEYMGLDNDVLNLEIELMGGQKIDLKALDTALSERADRKAGEDLDRDYERLKMSIEKKSSMLRDLLNKKEDTATKKEILKLKEQMRIMRADLKANYEKKMERDKTVRAVRKEVKSKSVPEEWRQQILQLVQKVKGLGTPAMTADRNIPSWQKFKDAKFGAEKQDLGVELAAPPIPEWLENLAEPISLSELSTADLKDLRTGIKSLAHIGRAERTILDGQERKRVQETVNECTENMGKITQTKYLTDREKAEFIGGIVDKTRGVVALMTQMRDLFRRADGYTKEGTGPNSKYITQRIHDAQVRELGLTDSFQKEFSSIWQPIAIHSNFTKEFVIEGIQLPKELMRRWGGKFSKDRVIAVALNMGNKGNLDALMKGYGWTMEDLGKIISTLSEEELFAVQKTWDMLERLRPHLEKTYKEMNGVDMKLVEAQAITVTSKEGANITLRGGYYPLQFDPELAQSIGEKEKIDNILNANAFLPAKPTVRKGMTMARTGSKKPPLLSFVSVVSRHLEDSIKYATHAAAVRDVYKIVSNAEYRDSFVSAFGSQAYEQIAPWLKACATINREPTHELKKFAKFLTSRGSLFAMGLSLRTSWMQFTSIGSSIKVDGLGNFMNGCWMFITKPRETARMVKEMSAYMNNRTKIYDKTVADTLGKYNPNATALRVGNHIFTRQQFDSACFALTAMADMAVAVPTWLGKYNAEIKKGLTEQDAIRKADEAVIMAQGSGMTMDTTSLMREKGAWEFLLMFMSFAMNWQNRQRFYFAGYKEYLKGNQSEIDHKEFFSHIALEWIMPPVLTVAMLSLQDDDYTLEEAKDDLMNEAVSYWLMGVPIIRDIYSGIGYGAKFGETAASKGIELGKQIYKDMRKMQEGKDMSYSTMKHIINFVGFNLGIPTNSFFRVGEGTYEWLEGDAGIGAIILGKPYKKK